MPIHEFAGRATAEQRAILMLMERVSAMEDQMGRLTALEGQMLAARAQAARLETWQLAGGGSTYTVGKRRLWSCQVPGTVSLGNGGYVALTDLGHGLVERALARRCGPLYEHINGGEYDRNGRMEPLESFLKARMHLGGLHGRNVWFLNDVDVGMLIVSGGNGTLIEVIEALHAALEEDDDVPGPPRRVYSIRFNRKRDSAMAYVHGLLTGTAPPPAPGGAEAALERYIAERPVADRRLAQGIRDTFVRSWAGGQANCSTKWGGDETPQPCVTSTAPL